jgi:Putative peptidoglycan binding domain
MKKLITILLAASLATAAGANAARPEDAEAVKTAPKSKSVAKSQIAPKQHLAPATTRVAPVHPRHTDVSKPKLEKSTTVHSKKLQTKELSTDTKSKKAPTTDANQVPAVQSADKKIATLPKEKIQDIQAKYKNFKAKPNTSIASAQFNANYQIAGAQNWSGPQYQVFASYRPQWHDSAWWQARYGANLLLIAGGWYYWDAGYWYPAWGYDPAVAYYPYDGPIYVGDDRVPFDQIVADCQATLQEQGYYKGEVDGLMGPLTREALASFQRDHGLITTAALDQPTLSSLGLG